MKTMLRVFFLSLLCIPHFVNAQCSEPVWSDFTFQKISGCMPVKYKFTDHSTACESVITSWFWEFGDGTTSAEQHPEHSFTSQAQFNVKLTVTDGNGNTIRRSKKVKVVASTFSVNLGADTTICFGTSLSLDAGIAGATYLWSTGETSRQINVLDDGEYSVTVTSSGCVAKDTMRLLTSASVLNKWTYIKDTACLPVRVAFADSSIAFCGQNITAWHWDFGDGTFSMEQNPVHGFTTTDSFIVKLTVTATSGSSSTTTKKIGIGNTSHTVNIPSEMKVCTGESLQIDAGVPGGEYNWAPSFGVNDVHQREVTIKPMVNTWYYVEVKKCMLTVRDSVYIIVDSIDRPLMEQVGNNLTTGTAASYEWYLDGVAINGASGKELRIDRQGFYAVRTTNRSGCGRTSDPKFFMPYSGKEKGQDIIRIKCSPNPTNGRLSVLLSEVPAAPAKITVYDRFGLILFSTLATGNVNGIDLIKHSKGLYYVEVNINNKKNIVPVVLQ